MSTRAQAAPFPVTIYHNPACGTSRKTLALIREAGHAPTVVEYLTVGWTRAQLDQILEVMAATPRDILRVKGSPAEELGLLDPTTTDERILEAMVAHPILVNRPIVATPRGARLTRPESLVLDLLDPAGAAS